MALAGCGGSEAKLEIRSTPTPLSATSKPMPARLAEAHGHLALGNVGLAIESFRKALREQPDSVDAMVGLADSYDRMARFDLSRRYYESALAIVPADTRVLMAFARSLETQGQSVEAAEVRSEIRARSAAAAPPPSPAVQAPIPVPKVAQALQPVVGPSVTVKLPPARPVAVVVTKPAIEPKPPVILPRANPELKIAAAPVAPIVVAKKVEPAKAPAAPVVVLAPAGARAIAAPASVAVKAAEPKIMAPPPLPAPMVASSNPIDVKLPAAALLKTPELVFSQPVVVASSPVEPKPAPATASAAPIVSPRKPVALAAAPAAPVLAPVIVKPVAAPLPPASEAIEIARKTPPSLSPETPAGPRLERLSLGEVALVTTGAPRWRAKVVSKTAQSTTVRYVPLRSADASRVKIRLLNAARYEGLAARTRRLLAQRGWRQVAIGNARRIRQSSLVLYPAHERALAKRLAAQFGIALAKGPSGTDVVVLLGRDATRRNPVRGG
jgi:hypothetical protein